MDGTPVPSATAVTKSLVERIIDRLNAQGADPVTWGSIAPPDVPIAVDDGAYGDPHQDRRPIFVQDALQGWQPIAQWKRNRR